MHIELTPDLMDFVMLGLEKGLAKQADDPYNPFAPTLRNVRVNTHAAYGHPASTPPPIHVVEPGQQNAGANPEQNPENTNLGAGPDIHRSGTSLDTEPAEGEHGSTGAVPPFKPHITPNILDQVPNWGKGLGVLGAGAGAGLIANSLIGKEEDEEGEEHQRMPWLGPLVGAGVAAGGAHLLSGGNYRNLINPEFWKHTNASPPMIPTATKAGVHLIKFAALPIPPIPTSPTLAPANPSYTPQHPPTVPPPPTSSGGLFSRGAPTPGATPPPPGGGMNFGELTNRMGYGGGQQPQPPVNQPNFNALTARMGYGNSPSSSGGMQSTPPGAPVDPSHINPPGNFSWNEIPARVPTQEQNTHAGPVTVPQTVPDTRGSSPGMIGSPSETNLPNLGVPTTSPGTEGVASIPQGRPSTPSLSQLGGPSALNPNAGPEGATNLTENAHNQQLSNIAERGRQLAAQNGRPDPSHPQVQQENLYNQLSQQHGESPGLWDTVTRIWSGLSPIQKTLAGLGLGLGAIGLLGMLTGNQHMGGATGLLMGLGGLAGGAYAAGAFDPSSNLRQQIGRFFDGGASSNNSPPAAPLSLAGGVGGAGVAAGLSAAGRNPPPAPPNAPTPGAALTGGPGGGAGAAGAGPAGPTQTNTNGVASTLTTPAQVANHPFLRNNQLISPNGSVGLGNLQNLNTLLNPPPNSPPAVLAQASQHRMQLQQVFAQMSPQMRQHVRESALSPTNRAFMTDSQVRDLTNAFNAAEHTPLTQSGR